MAWPLAVYVDVSNSGLPIWQVVPLTFVGCRPASYRGQYSTEPIVIETPAHAV